MNGIEIKYASWLAQKLYDYDDNNCKKLSNYAEGATIPAKT